MSVNEHNLEDREPIVDALLEEALGGAAPPDLSPRILQAWAALQESGHDLAVQATQEPLPPPIVAGSVVRTVSIPDERTDKAHRPRGRKNRRWVETYALVAAAALLAVAYVGYQLSRSAPGQPELGQASQDNLSKAIAVKPLPGVALPNSPATKIAEAATTNVTPQAVDPPAPDNAVASNSFPRSTSPESIAKTEVEPPKYSGQPGSSDAEVVAFINEQLREKWQESGVSPAAVASDSEWCRRTFLRVIGRIPTVEELSAFTADKSSGKHEQLVDRLLSDPKYSDEFAKHWSELLANVLIGRSLGQDPKEPASRAGLEQYLRESLLADKSYDRMVLELISATGAGRPGADNFNGAANFLLAHASDDATVATARTSRVFLGLQLQCVQCHNHPTAPLKQESFWAMNAFFRQMKVSGNQNDPIELTDRDYLGHDGRDEQGLVFYEMPNGVLKVAQPAFVDGRRLATNSGRVGEVNRRQQLAKMVVSSEYFSQTAVNRLWSQLLGFGFTQPVDDMVETNKRSHPELLERLSDEFVAHGHDLKRAMRWIALSDAFSRSSKMSGTQLADMPEAGSPPLFSRYYTRQLPAEEVSRSLQIAARLRRDAGSNIEQARVDWLALARKSSDGEEPVTILPNSPLVKYATTNAFDTMLHSVTNSKLKFEEKVEHLFLAALSRKPTRQESELARNLAGVNGQNETAALEDIWWAILNSSEFALDH